MWMICDRVKYFFKNLDINLKKFLGYSLFTSITCRDKLAKKDRSNNHYERKDCFPTEAFELSANLIYKLVYFSNFYVHMIGVAPARGCRPNRGGSWKTLFLPQSKKMLLLPWKHVNTILIPGSCSPMDKQARTWGTIRSLLAEKVILVVLNALC